MLYLTIFSLNGEIYPHVRQGGKELWFRPRGPLRVPQGWVLAHTRPPPLTVKATQNGAVLRRRGSLWLFVQQQPAPKPGIPETPRPCLLSLNPNPQKPQRVCCGKNMELEVRRPVPFSHLCPHPCEQLPGFL